MELSLFSRDTIAQATVIALSHQMFDGVVCLGICDKIVPGLLVEALRFGHLPMMFVPAGHAVGIANAKARVRQLFAQGEIGRDELLAAESASYAHLELALLRTATAIKCSWKRWDCSCLALL